MLRARPYHAPGSTILVLLFVVAALLAPAMASADTLRSGTLSCGAYDSDYNGSDQPPPSGYGSGAFRNAFSFTMPESARGYDVTRVQFGLIGEGITSGVSNSARNAVFGIKNGSYIEFNDGGDPAGFASGNANWLAWVNFTWSTTNQPKANEPAKIAVVTVDFVNQTMTSSQSWFVISGVTWNGDTSPSIAPRSAGTPSYWVGVDSQDPLSDDLKTPRYENCSGFKSYQWYESNNHTGANAGESAMDPNFKLYTTGQDVPTAPSQTVTRTSITSIQQTIGFPSDPGAYPVTDFKIYRSTSMLITCSSSSHVATVSSAVSVYDHLALATQTTYYFRVSAVNAAGEGDCSATASATTGMPPSAPRNNSATGGDTTLSQTWEAPLDDGGGPVTSFKIYRSTTSGFTCDNSTLLLSVAHTVFAHEHTGLVRGVTYYVRVSAVNAVGEGTCSSQAQASGGTAVFNLTAVVINATAIGLSWDDDATQGPWKILRGGELVDQASSRSWTDSNLTPSTTYIFRVERTANSTVGTNVTRTTLSLFWEGDFRFECNCTRLVPDQTYIVVYRNVTADHILTTWQLNPSGDWTIVGTPAKWAKTYPMRANVTYPAGPSSEATIGRYLLTVTDTGSNYHAEQPFVIDIGWQQAIAAAESQPPSMSEAGTSGQNAAKATEAYYRAEATAADERIQRAAEALDLGAALADAAFLIPVVLFLLLVALVVLVMR